MGSSHLSIFSIILPIYLTSIPSVFGTCWNPNLTDRNAGLSQTSYFPCNATAEVSMCCATWDRCLPNGLCQNIATAQYWRESCTDPTWESSMCIHLYLNLGSSDVALVLCEDGTWCFDSDCCAAGDGQTIPNLTPNSGTSSISTTPGFTTSTLPTTSSAATTTSSTATTTSTVTSPVSSALPTAVATTSASSSSEGLSTGAKVGIGVGVPIAVLLAATAAILASNIIRRQAVSRQGQTGIELVR
ncbi:hypothetical protein V8E54_006726 [Elaphomyces granulatus]